MIYDIDFQPLLAWPLIVGFLIVGWLIAAFIALRGGRGAGARTALIAVLAIIVAGPHITHETVEKRTDVALIVIDRTDSQTLGERANQTDLALNALTEKLADDTSIDLETITLENSDGGGTKLFDALEKARRTIPADRFAGAVLITDGAVHDGPDTKTLDGPLHVLLTGRAGETDRRVVIEQSPAYGFVGKPAHVRVRIDDLPNGTGTAKLNIARDGERILTMDVPIGVAQTVPIPIVRPGSTLIEVSTPGVANEVTTRNNASGFALRAVRDRLKVLLVSGEPHPGTRVWRHLLKSDPGVDLVHFTILRPPESVDATPADELALIFFPVKELFEEKIGEFDLIVFDRYQWRNLIPLRYLANIRDRVKEGGAVLMAAGPEFASAQSLTATPLGDILPVRPLASVLERRFLPRLTPAGRRHPVTRTLTTADDGLFSGPWFRQVPVIAEHGDVLMDGIDAKPLLAVSRVGKGKVAVLTSDHIWLWARGLEGGGPHAAFMRHLVHWLLNEPALEEEALSAEAEDGTLSVTRQSLSDEPATLTVTLPSGRTITRSVSPDDRGIAQTTVPISENGLIRVTDGTRTALAVHGDPDPLEWSDPRADGVRLSTHTKSTGGGVFRISDGLPDVRRVNPGRDTAGRGWIGFKRNNATVVTGAHRAPLLAGIILALMVLGALCVTWWREGR